MRAAVDRAQVIDVYMQTPQPTELLDALGFQQTLKDFATGVTRAARARSPAAAE
ncbi:MAG: hypothetical protein O7B81_03745 [Gammaproteobacteria bacterium]|nr:hypothetical protein [Gammaproteobacteria bacterium]